jgi:hypothetical protein
MNDTIARIAHHELGLETLETRNADRLDFHDLAVWQVRKALEAAYLAGQEAATPQGLTTAEARQRREVRETATAIDAIREAAARKPVAIVKGGRYLVIAQDEAARLETAGVEFAYLHECDGRVVTVPVN